jgi:glutamate decarboxylase
MKDPCFFCIPHIVWDTEETWIFHTISNRISLSPRQITTFSQRPLGILKDLETTLKYSVRTGHVRFFNQLWGGTDYPALIAEWLTSVMNSSVYTYEVSPVFSM